MRMVERVQRHVGIELTAEELQAIFDVTACTSEELFEDDGYDEDRAAEIEKVSARLFYMLANRGFSQQKAYEPGNKINGG